MPASRRIGAVSGVAALCLGALALGLAVRAVLPGIGTASLAADVPTPADETGVDTAAGKALPRVVAELYTVRGQVRGKVLIGDREVLRTLYPRNDVPPDERASAAAARINLALQEGARPDEFRAAEQGGEWMVVARERVIVTVAPREPEAYRLSAQALAERWASNIAMALHEAMGTKPGQEVPLGPLTIEARPLRVGEVNGALVLVSGREALRLTRGAAGMSAMQRAGVVVDRLKQAIEGGVLPQDIRPVSIGEVWVVQAGETLLVTVNEDDAADLGVAPDALAQTWATGIADAVRAYYAGAGKSVVPAPESWQPAEPYEDKWVPIISVLEGLKVGLARVTGPTSRVRQVQAVAQLETHWRNYLEIDIYVPISTKVPGKTLDRIQACGVTGLGDIKL